MQPPAPQPGPAPNPKAEIEELLAAKPDAEITAQELITEFKKNPSLSKYVGKVVDVTGKVSMYQYTYTGGDRPELFLSSLDVYFPCRQIDALARVAPGQTVTLRTRVQPLTGYTNCVIVKVEGPAPLELTADKLAEAYAKDKEATENEHKGKYVVLKGKARILKNGTSERIVLTSPGVKPEIVCRFSTDSEAVAKKHGWLKDGAEVAVLCQSIIGDPEYFSLAVVRPPLK